MLKGMAQAYFVRLDLMDAFPRLKLSTKLSTRRGVMQLGPFVGRGGVDRAVRAAGHERVLFIGSDAPSQTLSDLLAAQAALDGSDVVLVPARDGGVTLMGSRRAWPDLAPLPWSEPTLGPMLEECCRSHGRSVTRLPQSYDVDDVADLGRARRALAADDRPARRRLHQLLVKIDVSA